jgi:hypothetical protein
MPFLLSQLIDLLIASYTGVSCGQRGIVRHEETEIIVLAVVTTSDFAMAPAKLLGFDLCPRLKALRIGIKYVHRNLG